MSIQAVGIAPRAVAGPAPAVGRTEHLAGDPCSDSGSKDQTMRIFSRIGMVSTMSLAGVIASPAMGRSVFPGIDPPTRTITAATDSHAFALKDARGHYVALHFL